MEGEHGDATFTFSEGEPITSVEHFLAEIKRFAGSRSFRCYFRGQGEPGLGLIPSIGRPHYFVGQEITFTPAQEHDLLHRFRRHAYSHFSRVPTEWEVLFLARHHGLPTRLLDWTANPLVALYFSAFYERAPAMRKKADESPIACAYDGTVWAIEGRDANVDVFTETRAPLEIPGIRLVHPFNPTPRITAQAGMFTLHGDPWKDVVSSAGQPFRCGDLDVSRLKRWLVPGDQRRQIILDLERLDINSRTLFPDLDGLAKGLWQTEIIRQTVLTHQG